MSTEPDNAFLTVAKIIQQRRTTKLLADPANPAVLDDGSIERMRIAVNESVQIAGMAPFHHDRKDNGIAEPWRVTLLWTDSCRLLAKALPALVELPPKNRLPFLLSGCGAAIVVTWLPETGMADTAKQQHVNDEHLAATAAYVQNLLLLLESQGMESYWASGGMLASPSVLDRLTIPGTEKILAVVHVGMSETKSASIERLNGKNWANRSDASQWTRVPNLTE